MSLPPEHAALDAVPAPVMVVAENQVVHVNPALLALLGRTAEAYLRTPVKQLIEETIEPGDLAMVAGFNQARVAGQGLPDAYYMRVRTGDGRRLTLEVHSADGPRPGERTYLFRDARPEDDARRLSDALAAASWSLVPLRDEVSVLDAAADALAEQGFRVIFLRVEGERFKHLALRQRPGALEEFRNLAGRPIEQLPFPMSAAPQLAGLLQTRRAAFDQDTHRLVDALRPPDQAALIKAHMPRRAVNAPVFVDDEPYGVLSAQHEALSPTGVGAVELFAHRLGAALENVRHHQRAAAQLEELRRLQDRLVAQERLAMLGEAAAVLSHEVRNPVAAILNAMAVLRRKPEHDPEVVRMAEEEALRLDRLVHDLLHLARPLSPKVTELDLRVVTERAINGLRERIHAARLRVQLDAPARLPVGGDSFLLGLALENLLTNAVRASPPGGQVQVTLQARPEGAVVAVDDQGPGIKPDLAERIFEPFFTTSATGTGLGLAVVRKVVEAHHGQVRALPTGPLGGARFEVVLPG